MPPQTSRSTSRFKGLLSLIISLLLIVAALWVIANRQSIIDHLSVWQNQPSSAIEQLAERSGMSKEGRFLFFASVPEISSRQKFIDQCGVKSEQTAVLGCYSGQRIYIFDVNDQRLDGIKEVTAGHEMLHAAYDRMSRGEQATVNKMVDDAYRQINEQRLDELIEYYDKTEPGQRYNELYAILGTEYADLPTELEKSYQRYFNDRSLVVKLAQKYQQTFEELSTSQQALVDELNRLSDNIQTSTEGYNQAVSRLRNDINSFNQRAERGQFESQVEFDAERANLVERQTSLRAEQQRIEGLIARYEKQRSALNELNLLAEDLNQSINANLPEAPKL